MCCCKGSRDRLGSCHWLHRLLKPACCHLQDSSPDVRQSAFALVGDMSKVCAQHLLPVTGDLIRLGIAQLEPAAIRQDTMSACNNACWSLGEPCLLPCTHLDGEVMPRQAKVLITLCKQRMC